MKKFRFAHLILIILLFAASMASAQTRHTKIRHRHKTHNKTIKQQRIVERMGKPVLIQKHQPRVVSGQSAQRIQLQLMQARKHEIEQAKVDKAQKEAAKDQKRVH